MTAPRELCELIEVWRDLLAGELALRDSAIPEHELNRAVQVTINRILFLRMCEDRGIDPDGQLHSQLTGLAGYDRLKEQSPFEFSALPPETLGHVYEQLLGKMSRLTADRRVVTEDRPEVKKAVGVYYTPASIVDYIVKHTVGKLLKGKTPTQAGKLHFLDPACGAGTFLLRIYQYLLDWHRDWYMRDGPEQHTNKIHRGTDDTWRLTTTEKTRILLCNIYGVDIDPQAVEITRLALLLKVLEGESHETFGEQRRQFHDDAWPDLGGNIKCGNALVGPDFHERQLPMMLNEDERFQINVFDWNAEFQPILSEGGFHAVIGNPPWGQKAIAANDSVKGYLWKAYPSSRGIFDLFRPFIERGIRLLAERGMFGMVLPDIVLLKDYPETRRYLLEWLRLDRMDWWGRAFPAAVIDAATVIGCKKSAPADHCVRVTVHEPGEPFSHDVPQSDFWSNPRFNFNLSLTPKKRQILNRLQKFPVLGEFFEIHEGVHSGNMRGELFVASRVDETCRELFFGRSEIVPYHLQWEGKYLRLAALPKTRTRQRYANLGRPEWHERDKLLVRRTGDHVLAAVDHTRRYASNNFFVVFPNQECGLCLDGLAALLNSRFMTWYFRTIEPRRGRVFAELKIKHLATFPHPSETACCKELNRLGRARAKLAAKWAAPSARQNVAAQERMASDLDRRIEDEVRAIFDLPKNLSVEIQASDGR